MSTHNKLVEREAGRLFGATECNEDNSKHNQRRRNSVATDHVLTEAHPSEPDLR